MHKKASDSKVLRLAVSGMRLKLQQSQNDLAAARRHVEMHRSTELRLADQINTMRNDHATQSNELCKAYRERDDWRDAFKLIMKLVK